MESHRRACESQSVLINSRLGSLREPMRTRVQFYLGKLRALKNHGDVVTQDDLDRSMGRALQDKLDDNSIRFNREDLQKAIAGINAGKTVNLKEVVDALPS